MTATKKRNPKADQDSRTHASAMRSDGKGEGAPGATNAAQASSATATTPSRDRRAEAPALPFTIEVLNRFRPASNQEGVIFFEEDWRAVPGSRETPMGEAGHRLVSVPGSHEGGAALGHVALWRLHDFLQVVANDKRWARAREHDAINTLAEAAFYSQQILLGVLSGFELANTKSPLSKAEKFRLDVAVKTAAEVVKTLGDSKEFKALVARREHSRTQANLVRAEIRQALEEIVAELDREHPDWSNVKMAEELKGRGIERTDRRIGQIRNEQHAARRKLGR
jgi:hypothetical protein